MVELIRSLTKSLNKRCADAMTSAQERGSWYLSFCCSAFPRFGFKAFLQISLRRCSSLVLLPHGPQVHHPLETAAHI